MYVLYFFFSSVFTKLEDCSVRYWEPECTVETGQSRTICQSFMLLLRVRYRKSALMFKGSRKKNIVRFLVARPLRPYTPPPRSSLVATFFFSSFKTSSFFLVARPLPLPPLSGRATKKRNFFCGFP